VLNIIPYFGLLVEITLAVIVSLFSGDPGFQVPLVIVIYLAQNLLETSFIIPKIVGNRIGLHPALLILSLFVFSYFFGFIGMLIALPTMSIIIMFFRGGSTPGNRLNSIKHSVYCPCSTLIAAEFTFLNRKPFGSLSIFLFIPILHHQGSVLSCSQIQAY
jgi:hypothetical protein